MNHKDTDNKRSENRVKRARWIPPLSIIGGLCIWEILVRLSGYPAFILPAPSRIFTRFLSASRSGILWPNVWVSFYEVLLGLLIGTAAALTAGYFLAHSPVAEKIIFPYIVVSQAIPLAAILDFVYEEAFLPQLEMRRARLDAEEAALAKTGPQGEDLLDEL